MKFSEFPFYRPDIKKLAEKFDGLFLKFNASESFKEQHKIFLEIYEILRETGSMDSLAQIRFSTDVNNESYIADKEYFDEILTDTIALNKKFLEYLLNSKYIDEYEKRYGINFIKSIRLEAELFSPEIAEDIETESRIEADYEKLRGKAVANFEGKEISFSELYKYFTSTDRETRKKAYDVYWKFFEENADKINGLLDEVIKVRTRMAKKLGYENFVQLAYARLNKEYKPDDAERFRESVLKYVVPLYMELRKKQAARIGIEKMKHYDTALNFKNGNPLPKGNPEWILEQAVKMYSELSPETKEFIIFMKESELLDLYPKKGKLGGGYCAYISKYKAPFIFANMNGTAGDIDVLTHEAGHALQNYLCKDTEVDEERNTSAEIGETHSMSMEFLTYDYMPVFFGGDVDKFYYNHQEHFINSCVGTAKDDEFQYIIYSQPELSIEERNKVWRNLVAKYSPDIDFDGNEFLEGGHTWQSRSIFFKIPFYDLDYAIAQFCAYQFLFRHQVNPKKTFREYIDFCKLGGRYTFSQTLKESGLKNPFDEETVKEMLEKVKHFMSGIDDSKF